MKTCGIYTITNQINGKMYIGFSEDVNLRWINHIRALKDNIHYNEYLQRAWNKYGEVAFKFELLEECEPDILASEEHYWCTMLDLRNRKRGYNIKPTHPKDEKRCSDETRKKMSQSFWRSRDKEEWSKTLSKKR